MDVKPEHINPDIVAAAKNNPPLREIFELYLSSAPVKDDEPLDWRDALEMMVMKLAEQYAGAILGWKQQTKKKKAPEAPLVNEKRELVMLPAPGGGTDWGSVVETEVQSPEKVQLEIAKGMIAKLISPARMAWIKSGKDPSEFPALVIGRSFVEQAEALLGGKVDTYVQKDACKVCGNHAFFIEDGKPRCAVCEAKSRSMNYDFKNQQLVLAVWELLNHPDNRVRVIPGRLAKLIPDLQERCV